ncbi:hypothetical protein OG884_08415 [Streptosporangium sp. NBC_01755]|uniref:hypothetical protein n=1 Tax=unclassified Streptosporangium TaxID=2632669 RepID=UPI002DD8F364|nr:MULTISPECIES: hypothetical protein [unclassified Streptosporangium]WSA26650.1 hypothetical protein OIE13_01745 [Streptosporangium sp. NBC_01810]WSD01926.1 hypothetical protein OG884_08415 [Streptosporangium sp. NBC_01755]
MTTASDLTLIFSGRPSATPSWDLMRAASLTPSAGPRIRVEELDVGEIDPDEIKRHVEHVMDELGSFASELAVTPSGASWLHVHQVPVRRLVSQVVRKLLALSAWPPFTSAPGPITVPPGQALIGERDSSSQEYRSYTVTWPGIAYLLGAEVLAASAPLPRSFASAEIRDVPSFPTAAVVAVSWSSRHAGTLLPVLAEVSRNGQRSLLLDLATDPAQRCLEVDDPLITVHRIPLTRLLAPGGLPVTTLHAMRQPGDSRSVLIGAHKVLLDRLADLAARLLERSAGCTQPSWCATVNAEAWLDGVIAATRPATMLVSNDTSPLGALAVHTADRIGVRTVYVQHGAWIPGSVAWPVLHCRHIVVMGERDAASAAGWVRRDDAEIHVLGQPRFDALASVDRPRQRRYLESLLTSEGGRPPERIVVWACQPFSRSRLRTQAEILLRGMQAAEGGWELVIAPHPAQDPHVFEALSGLKVAVADPATGARGCLVGSDAIVTVSSTCGIEAMLLNVPVLELRLPGEQTLGLAEHQAARACADAADVAAALSHLAAFPRQTSVSGRAKNAVCRWDGATAAAVAKLVLGPSS